jgi:hypothetical protein
MRPSRRAVALALLLAAACGRKGPPLEPFVRIPAAVETISARRVGDEVFVTLTVPAENVDESTPVALARVEVWGYTGTTPPAATDWGVVGTLVAVVPAEAPAPGTAPAPPARMGAGTARVGPAGPAVVIVVRVELTAGQLVQGPLPPADEDETPAARVTPADPPPLRRFYAAFAFDGRARPGPPGAVAALGLDGPPPAPAAVRVAYTEVELELAWAPSDGLVGFLLDRSPVAEALPPGVRPPVAAGGPGPAPAPSPTRYNLYDVGSAAPASAPVPADDWRGRPPAPLNAEPLAVLAFREPVRFGVERCFVVRAARGAGVGAIEGAASPRVCVTPQDVFPPAVPTGLAAVPAAGRIDLVWAPNIEADLAGYLVLRGEAGAAALAPITAEPVRQARFLDDNVVTGVRYQYAVVAVDGRAPAPNRSTPSARVEATAR